MTQKGLKRVLKVAVILIISLIQIIIVFLLPAFASSGDASRTLTTQDNAHWNLFWSDEFNGPQGTKPDASKWTPAVGGGGWGNQQLEYDTNNQNDYLDGRGNLVLESRQNTDSAYQCWYGQCQYTSAFITSSQHFNFTYGYVEASIKSPAGQGVWPTFWMLGTDAKTAGWPACGEIDVMENVGKKPGTLYGTLHGPGYSTTGLGGTYTLPTGNLSDGYHLYAAEWTPDLVRFFIDGKNYFTINKTTVQTHGTWVFDHPFYLLLNVAIGGTFPGSPDSTSLFPKQMLVDYVRVYTNNLGSH